MVIEYQRAKLTVCPSQHAEHNELRNHTLNIKACLEGKGFLQTLTPSLCSRPAADQATTTTVAAAVNSRAPTQPTHRTRAPLQDFADVRSRMAMESQRQQRHAAPTSHLSADSGCSVFLLRVRRSYPSSSTLPYHRRLDFAQSARRSTVVPPYGSRVCTRGTCTVYS